jgi:uncharacterized RDD family membrane protein YckC
MKKNEIFVYILIFVAFFSIINCFKGLYIDSDDNNPLSSIRIFLIDFISIFSKMDLSIFYSYEFNNQYFIKSYIFQNLLTLIFSIGLIISSILYIATKGIKGKLFIKVCSLIIFIKSVFIMPYTFYAFYDLFKNQMNSIPPGDISIYVVLNILSFTSNFFFIYLGYYLFTFLDKNKLENVAAIALSQKEISVNNEEQSQKIIRFLNYFFDVLFIYMNHFLILRLFNRMKGNYFEEDISDLEHRLIFISAFILYYVLLEKVFGATVGKAITNSKVVNDEGENISLKQAIIRTFSRLVPLESISLFFSYNYPWHDKWSNTFVVNNKV